MSGAGEKRERSDKKRQVKPLIPLDAKEAIHRISHITNTPIKDVCEFLALFVVQDTETLSKLSNHFRRGVVLGNTYYTGNIDAHTIDKRLKVQSDMVNIKFKRDDYEYISTLAYALDCTPTRATAVLLEHATRNIKAVNEYVYQNLASGLTDGQMRELRKVLTYINRHNKDRSSWMTILSMIVGDVRPATKKLYELVEEFLSISNKKKD